MQDRNGIPQHVENPPRDVSSEAAKDISTQPASKQAAMPEPGSDRRGSVLNRFYQWVARRIVQDVPEDSALCEFDCQKGQCTNEEWAHCDRRLARAAGELWPGTETKTSEQTTDVHEGVQLENIDERQDSDSASSVITK